MRLFLSYRHEDSQGYTGWLRDLLPSLASAGDQIEVFLDVEASGAGQDFVQKTTSAARDSDAVLVIIGKRWLSAATDRGTPGINKPHDYGYVRMELTEAVKAGVPLFVVLVDGAKRPTKKEWPKEFPEDLIDALARATVVKLDCETDAGKLVKHLYSIPIRRSSAPTKMAQLCIVNGKPGFIQDGSALKVIVNGKKMGQILADRSVYKFSLEPGTHRVQLRRGLIYRSPQLEVTLGPGDSATISYIWGMGGITLEVRKPPTL